MPEIKWLLPRTPQLLDNASLTCGLIENTQVAERQVELQVCTDYLHWPLVRIIEARAQTLVTVYNAIDRTSQRRYIKRSAHAPRVNHVVLGSRRLQLLHEPEALLCVRL